MIPRCIVIVAFIRKMVRILELFCHSVRCRLLQPFHRLYTLQSTVRYYIGTAHQKGWVTNYLFDVPSVSGVDLKQQSDPPLSTAGQEPDWIGLSTSIQCAHSALPECASSMRESGTDACRMSHRDTPPE